MRSPFVLSLHLIVFIVGVLCFFMAAWPMFVNEWPWRTKLIAAGLFFVFLSQLITI